MKIKTKEEARQYLKNIAETVGFETVKQAADYVLMHYDMYDYQGSDRLFIAYTEEILHEAE